MATPEIKEIIDKVMEACNKKGTAGVGKLATALNIKKRSSRTLSLEQFKKGMDDFGTGLTEDQVKQLFEYADKDKSGTMNYDEFVNVLRDPLSPECRDVVLKVFAVMDKTGDGVVTSEDMRKYYNTDESSDYEAYLKRFDSGDGGKDAPIEVTEEEFLEYYTKQRFSNYKDDSYFIKSLKRSWKLE